MTPNRDPHVEALKRDWNELQCAFYPEHVRLRRMKCPEGYMAVIRCETVDLPSYKLTGEDDKNPKPCNDLWFDVWVKNGYPDVRPIVRFPSDRFLAAINTFRSGIQCTGEHSRYSSLRSLCEKTVKAIIYAHENFDSVANTNMIDWQRSKIATGAFPTVPVSKVIRPDDEVDRLLVQMYKGGTKPRTVSAPRRASTAPRWTR